MCFGGGGGQQQQPKIVYMPYEQQMYPSEQMYQYPLASQVYGERYAQQAGGYGYPGPQTNPNTGASGILSRPTYGGSSGAGGGVTNIGGEAHMGNIPGAQQLLARYNNNNSNNNSPQSSWV
jgi:hypothetical protein